MRAPRSSSGAFRWCIVKRRPHCPVSCDQLETKPKRLPQGATDWWRARRPRVRLRGWRAYRSLAMWIFRRYDFRVGGGRVSPSIAAWACGSARKNHCRTLGTFSFSRSAGLTPNACDVCQIVRSVAFWSPRSIPLMKARSTPMRSATASWLMPAASRNRQTLPRISCEYPSAG